MRRPAIQVSAGFPAAPGITDRTRTRTPPGSGSKSVCWRNSIQFKLVLVVNLECRVLLVLAQHTIADDEQLDVVAHEAVEGVFRRAHDRLAADVEAGIDQHWAPGLGLETLDQGVKARIGVGVDGLDARRIIGVGQRSQRSRYVQVGGSGVGTQ